MPVKGFTRDAMRVTGLSKKKLAKMGAKPFTKGQSEILVNFLNECRDLPIVVHCLWVDREKVLEPAFRKVGNLERLPDLERWKDTFVLGKELTNLKHPRLDDLLEELGEKVRDIN